MITPSLKRIFEAEQVTQQPCITPAKYLKELEYTTQILQAHTERIRSYIADPAHRDDRFNASFLDLMDEVVAPRRG